MTRFYKKGPLGMTKAEAGMSDPEVMEVRMSIKEYRELLDSVRSAEKSAASARAMAEDRIAGIREKTKEKIEEARRQAEAEAEKRISAAQDAARRIKKEATSLQEQLAEAQTAVQNEKNLNENLVRIMRERANQSRGIKPKKQHDGYIVLESRQWKEKYKVDVWDTEDHMMRYGGNFGVARKKGYLRTVQKTADTWKSLLQTPYESRIPLDQVRYKVEEELFRKGILTNIGCTGMYDGYKDGAFDKNENILYRWVFKANHHSRLWELEIYTTNELTVPEYRLPSQKIKEKSKKRPEPKSESTNIRENVVEEGENLFADLDVVDEDDPEWDEDFFEDFDPM